MNEDATASGGDGIGDLVIHLGCKEEDLFRRLKVHPSLEEAWEKHDAPQDLVWLAIRIANIWEDRLKVARALATILDGISDDPGIYSVGAILDVLIVDPLQDRASSVAELVAHARGSKEILIKLERTLRGRELTAPRSERAAYLCLEAIALALDGGWRSKAADRAYAGITIAAKLEKSEGLILATLRSEIPFPEFRSSWFKVNPPRAKGYE